MERFSYSVKSHWDNHQASSPDKNSTKPSLQLTNRCWQTASEAGGELVLIQTSLLFSFKCKLVSIRTTWFEKQKQWGLYQNEVTCSLAAFQRPGHWGNNFKMVSIPENNSPAMSECWLLAYRKLKQSRRPCNKQLIDPLHRRRLNLNTSTLYNVQP